MERYLLYIRLSKEGCLPNSVCNNSPSLKNIFGTENKPGRTRNLWLVGMVGRLTGGLIFLFLAWMVEGACAARVGLISQNKNSLAQKRTRVRWKGWEKVVGWRRRQDAGMGEGQRPQRVGGSRGGRRKHGTSWAPRPSGRCQSSRREAESPRDWGGGGCNREAEAPFTTTHWPSLSG